MRTPSAVVKTEKRWCLAVLNAQCVTAGVWGGSYCQPGVPAEVLLLPLSSQLTWGLEFCILFFTVSTNIRLLNTERILTFSLFSSFPFASEESGSPAPSTFRCCPFGRTVGPS